MARRMQPADRLLAPAVAETINELSLTGTDAAAIQLARRYATAIDQAEDTQAVLAALGPKLLAVLESLGATPAARAKLRGGASANAPSGLGKLRATRTA